LGSVHFRVTKAHVACPVHTKGLLATVLSLFCLHNKTCCPVYLGTLIYGCKHSKLYLTMASSQSCRNSRMLDEANLLLISLLELLKFVSSA
jgi:hypothetical protein